MKKFEICISFAFMTLFADRCTSLDNGLALTPPMGWISSLGYGCNVNCKKYPDKCISEKLIKNVADSMVNEGYKDAGYEYVIMDDCWMNNTRSEDGKLQADKKRFPNGIKHLADYIHARGLKFGILIRRVDADRNRPDSQKKDAELLAEWNVDYVKLIYSTFYIRHNDADYIEFGQLLNATGRPMVFSCSFPLYQEHQAGLEVNYSLAIKHCNLWRQYTDGANSYTSFTNIMDHYAQKQDSYQKYAGPGHWNDPDMLIIGNDGLNVDQAKAQMAVWAILAAPLLMSTDLKNMKPEFKEILQNKEIITVNQDRLGIQGKRVLVNTNQKINVWVRPIEPVIGNQFSYAIAYISRGTNKTSHDFSTTLNDLGLQSQSGYMISELIGPGVRNKFFLKSSDALAARLNSGGAVMFKAEALANSGPVCCCSSITKY